MIKVCAAESRPMRVSSAAREQIFGIPAELVEVRGFAEACKPKRPVRLGLGYTQLERGDALDDHRGKDGVVGRLAFGRRASQHKLQDRLGDSRSSMSK